MKDEPSPPGPPSPPHGVDPPSAIRRSRSCRRGSGRPPDAGLEDDSWLSRYAAAEALERGEAVVERLKRDFRRQGRSQALSLQLLVRIFGAKATNFFTNCRSHGDPDIRHYAIRALGETDEVGDPSTGRLPGDSH